MKKSIEWALSYLVSSVGVDKAVILQFDGEVSKLVASIPGMDSYHPCSWEFVQPLPLSPPQGTCCIGEGPLPHKADGQLWVLEDINNAPGDLAFTGARSYLYSAICVGGFLWGAIGVSNVDTPRVWSDNDKVLVQSAATHISNAITSKAITENVRLQSSINSSKKLLQKVIDSTSVYIGVKDEGGKFILVNKALSEASGYTHPRYMLGTSSWGDYFPPNSEEEEQEVLTSKSNKFTMSVRGVNGNWFTSMRVYVPADELCCNASQGTCIDTSLGAMVVTTLVDITPLAIITARLQDFTYVASHDLQEPLRTITSFLGLLKKRCSTELSEQATLYIDTAMDASSRMGDLITDLLAYTRLDSKANPFEWVPLSTAFTMALKNLSGKLTLVDCPTIIYDPSLSVEVWGDRVQLITCLQNMLSNAIKFSNGAPIDITYTDTSTHWEVCIVDHGIGVPEGMEEAIFKPFKRAHSGYEGTGMGLPIVERVANMHNGRAWITHTSGGGCTVHITIGKPMI